MAYQVSQQSDPLTPLSCHLAIDDTTQSVKYKFNVQNQDIAAVSDDVGTMLHIISITNYLSKIGLVVNPSKSEVININYTWHHFVMVKKDIQRYVSCAEETKTADLTIRGSPI